MQVLQLRRQALGLSSAQGCQGRIGDCNVVLAMRLRVLVEGGGRYLSSRAQHCAQLGRGE